jgi:uncharacterized tellurite resistance protein B-like protein
MRRYPTNSPQAAARIVALTVLADGDISSAEFELLALPEVHAQLGLDRDALATVLHDAYDDLEPSARLNLPNTCPVDEFTLRDIVGEIDDPELQQRLLRLCVDIAHSDGTVDIAESIIISSAMEQWGLHAEIFRPAD